MDTAAIQSSMREISNGGVRLLLEEKKDRFHLTTGSVDDLSFQPVIRTSDEKLLTIDANLYPVN